MAKYIDFNDSSIPIGKRKQTYIAYLLKKGWELIDAQKAANKRFGFEVKYPKLLFLYKDLGRSRQNSFRGIARDIEDSFSYYTKRAGHIEYIELPHGADPDEETKRYEQRGWTVIYTELIP